MIDPAARKTRRRFPLWTIPAALFTGGAIFAFATGYWVRVYAFFAQYNQGVYWVAAIGVLVPALILAALRSWGIEDLPPEKEAVVLGTGRLRRLRRRIVGAGRSPYLQAILADELAHLASEVVALREGATPAQIRRQIEADAWVGSDPIRRLIRREIPEGLTGHQFAKWYEEKLAVIEAFQRGETKRPREEGEEPTVQNLNEGGMDEPYASR